MTEKPARQWDPPVQHQPSNFPHPECKPWQGAESSSCQLHSVPSLPPSSSPLGLSSPPVSWPTPPPCSWRSTSIRELQEGRGWYEMWTKDQGSECLEVGLDREWKHYFIIKSLFFFCCPFIYIVFSVRSCLQLFIEICVQILFAPECTQLRVFRFTLVWKVCATSKLLLSLSRTIKPWRPQLLKT